MTVPVTLGYVRGSVTETGAEIKPAPLFGTTPGDHRAFHQPETTHRNR
jgi:hypothetical protein